jgi:hypothetical protein
MNINSIPWANRKLVRRASVLLVGAVALGVSACGTESEVPTGQLPPVADAPQAAPKAAPRGPVTADNAERRAEAERAKNAPNVGSLNGVPIISYDDLLQAQQEQEQATKPPSRSPWPRRS